MAAALEERRDGYTLGFEETELRLGLPGDGEAARGSTKRVFSETIDLKLKLQTTDSDDTIAKAEAEEEKMKRSASERRLFACANDPEKPRAPKDINMKQYLVSSVSHLDIIPEEGGKIVVVLEKAEQEEDTQYTTSESDRQDVKEKQTTFELEILEANERKVCRVCFKPINKKRQIWEKRG